MKGFKLLAKLLGVDTTQAEKLWQQVTLDGDEQHAIGYRLGLPYNADVGSNGEYEFNRGIKKLKAAIGKATKPLPRPAAKTKRTR